MATAAPALTKVDRKSALRPQQARAVTARYAKGTNLVLLDADVARAFPDPAVINRILRAVAEATPLRPRKKVGSTATKVTKARRKTA